MKKILASLFVGVLILELSAGSIFAEVNPITPSTNDINRTNGWAHVDQLSKGVGTTDLKFISTRNFYSCFEYRTDGDTSQVILENGGNNYNANITDGLYPYYCQKNNYRTATITADEYVEVRMVFGAETDERFDWTKFDVESALIKICHAKPPLTAANGYELLNISKNAVKVGHSNHAKDIIPPFDDYSGKNWDSQGQVIWNNDCVAPSGILQGRKM